MNDDHDPTTAEVYDALRRQVDEHTDVDRSLMDLHERVGRRRRWATTGIAAALVVLVAGGALALTTFGPEPTDPATTPAPSEPKTSDPSEGRCRPPVTFVHLDTLATPEQIQGVQDELATLGLEPYEFLDRETTYRDFRREHADQPDLMEAVSPDQLSESFRITTDVSSRGIGLLRSLPGVVLVEPALECPPGTDGPSADRASRSWVIDGS